MIQPSPRPPPSSSPPAAPRRICFLMPFHIMEMRGGGAEVQAWLLARELARRGHEVCYVAQSVRGKAGRVERIDGVEVHWLAYREHLRSLSAGKWYRALRRIDPDLVIQRMTSEATGAAGLYARLHKKPFAWVCTGNAVPVRWLFLRRQARANRDKAPGALRGLVFLADAAARDLLRHLGMRFVTHAFTQNERQDRALERSFGLASRRLISGHEPPRAVVPAESRRRGGVVLWVGTLSEIKRPWKFGELARLFSGSPLRFVLLGGHSDRAWVEQLRAGLPDNVEWLGPRPFEEALAWFDEAAVYVNTATRDGEGFPNTFIQAWLRGVPILSLGVDPDGLVRARRLGHVAHDVPEMADALRRLLADPDDYAETAARVAAFARTRYTVNRVADSFLAEVSAGADARRS